MQVRGIIREYGGLTGAEISVVRHCRIALPCPVGAAPVRLRPLSTAAPPDLLLSIIEWRTAGSTVARMAEQEASVNRLTNRIVAVSASMAACGLLLTGCGAGQIAQTANQHAAVNGTSADVKRIALRNVHLLATQTSDSIQPGSVVPLLLIAANDSPDVDDALMSITSDIGSVALTGDASLPAEGVLIVGATGQAEPMDATAAPAAEVTLAKPISNGLTYNFTFTFEKSGAVTVAVPISAGEPTAQ